MGRPRSLEHQLELRPDSSKGHLPLVDDSVHECAVCCKIREVRKLKLSEWRHETKIKCSTCNVNVCLTSEVSYHCALLAVMFVYLYCVM